MRKFFLVALSSFITLVNIVAQKGTNTIITCYYKNGKIEKSISVNKKGLKNGESFYYAESGDLDSSSFFSNGKLNGLTKIYYSNNDIFYFEYKNGLLISHKIYDSVHNLKYESPLDIKSIKKTVYRFTSGRDYFDNTKTDTLIIDKNIPIMNSYVYFPGATATRIDSYSWALKNWGPQPNSTNGKMVVSISQFCVEDAHVSRVNTQLKEEIIFIKIK